MEKKIKILFAINCMNIGGAPTVVLEQSRKIDENKFDVHLLTLYRSRKNNYLNRLDYLRNGRFTQLDLDKRNILFNFNNWRKIYRLIKKEKFDIVYTHLFITNLMVRSMSILARVPVILSFEHSFYSSKSLLSKLIDRFLSRYTYKIIVPSEEIAQFTSQCEKISRDKFFVIPNPVTIPDKEKMDKNKLKNELGLPADSYVAVTLGRFSKEKCQNLFIEIAGIAVKKIDNLYFLLIGYGPFEKALKEEIGKKGLEERCRIVNNPERAKEFLFTGDVFISTSEREGQPLAILEAMKAGLPIVSFENNGANSIINDKENGILIPFGNIDAAVNAVVSLNENISMRNQLVANALNKLEHFEISRNIKKLENLIITEISLMKSKKL